VVKYVKLFRCDAHIAIAYVAIAYDAPRGENRNNCRCLIQTMYRILTSARVPSEANNKSTRSNCTAYNIHSARIRFATVYSIICDRYRIRSHDLTIVSSVFMYSFY